MKPHVLRHVVDHVADPVEDEFVWTMRNVGIEHVLLGSDYRSIHYNRTWTHWSACRSSKGRRRKSSTRDARALFGLK
ncbi:MAG TPA: hypothetical protein VEA63_13695 [Opitutus sp.]|nr:hypothetical protein [Opitutus sp.]